MNRRKAIPFWFCRCAAASVTTIIVHSSALGGVTPANDMILDLPSGSIDLYDSNFVFPDGDELVFQGSVGTVPGFLTGTDSYGLSWEIRTNLVQGADRARLSADFTYYNNSDVNHTFWILLTKGGLALTDSTTSAGSIEATIQDGDGDGALFQTVTSGPFQGDPIYRSYIDGAAQQELWPAAYTLTTGAFGSQTDTSEFPAVPTSQPNSSVGIWLKFEVSAFDSVNMLTTLDIQVVPAPGTFLVLGAMVLIDRRRRRRDKH